jgi:hypothetical protein
MSCGDGIFLREYSLLTAVAKLRQGVTYPKKCHKTVKHRPVASSAPLLSRNAAFVTVVQAGGLVRSIHVFDTHFKYLAARRSVPRPCITLGLKMSWCIP